MMVKNDALYNNLALEPHIKKLGDLFCPVIFLDFGRSVRKHTEIITKNITINNLPTPLIDFCFSVEKNNNEKNCLKAYFLIDLSLFFSYPIHIAV